MDNNIDKKEDNDIFHKLLKDKRAWILAVVVILMFITIGVYFVNKEEEYRPRNNNNNSEKRKEEQDKKEEPVTKTYKVKVVVKFERNLVFSTYDVEVKLEDYKKLLKHGENHEFELELKEGNHLIKFTDDNDSTINKSATIKVNTNMEVGYKITCHYDRIDVEELYVDKDEIIKDDQIKIDFDKSEFESKDKEEVIKKLKGYGFTNIKENPLYDIVIGLTSEGETKEVTIDGKTSYRRGEIYNNDVEIVVSYHMNKLDDPSRVKAPYDTSTAKDKNYKDVEQAFKDAGFTNVNTETETTTTESLNEKVLKITISSFSVDKEITYEPDQKVLIRYYKYEKPKEEPKKEEPKKETPKKETPKDPYSTNEYYNMAKTAFERTGKKYYRYGIKFHWILSGYDFSYKGNGVWHIEVGVDITNQYGTKAKDLVAYGDVNFKKNTVSFAVKSKY